jgi:hypothetical protein
MIDLWKLFDERYVRSGKKDERLEWMKKRHNGNEQKMVRVERMEVFWEV